MSQYIAALLARPASSKDSHLNFVSDVVSQQEIADMLKEVTGKEVKPDYVTEEQAHGYIAKPERIAERAKRSRFAADFWYIVRLQQGASPSSTPRVQLLAVNSTRTHCLCRPQEPTSFAGTLPSSTTTVFRRSRLRRCGSTCKGLWRRATRDSRDRRGCRA